MAAPSLILQVLQNLSALHAIAALGSIAIAWLAHFFYSYEWPVPGVPQAGKVEKGLIGFFSNKASKAKYRADSLAVFREGLEEHHGNTFQVVSSQGPKVVIPPTSSMIDAIKSDKRLDFNKSVAQRLNSSLPGLEIFSIGPHNEIITSAVRVKLTQALPKVTDALCTETLESLNAIFGASPSWESCGLRESITEVVARLSACVFLGPDMAHNREWVRISINYTIDAFLAIRGLQKWPRFLRPLVHRFLPHSRNLQAEVEEARRIISPFVERRRKEIAQGIERLDTVQWIEEMAKGRRYDAHTCQLALSLAAIHTTSLALTQTLLDIVLNPELMQPLREEIARVFGEDGGWKKTSLYKLRLMDSVMKESQRLSPPAAVTMGRYVEEPVVLPDGTRLPVGTYMAVPQLRNTDPAIFKDPKKFDGYRFLRMREQEGAEHKWQFVTTSNEHLVFGHGTHACPGRFFASNEIKIALVHMLIMYDWRLAAELNGKVEPRNLRIEDEIVPNPWVKVEYRRREEREVEARFWN